MRLQPRSYLAWTAALVPTLALVWALTGSPLVGAPFAYPKGVTIHDPTRAWQGYNLLIDWSREPALGQIVLIDMAGNEIQTWPSPLTSSDRAQHVEALPGGNVLAIFQDLASPGYTLVEMDWNGAVIWQYAVPAGVKLHHDVERLANGNTLILLSEEIVDPEIGPNAIWDDVIQEIDPSGQVVWRWSTAEHFDQLPYSDVETVFMWFANANQRKKNLFHTNAVSTLPPNAHSAIDPRFAAGNVLVSQRDTSTVFLVDRSTGEVVWVFRAAMGQHTPHMLEPSQAGAGNILMLDNGGDAGYPTIHRLWSQVVEIDPLTWSPVWTYDATDSGSRHREAFLSVRMGGAQRLPNGNTLITEGSWGRVFEVTPAGEIVWEFLLPSDRDVYRCERVHPGWPPFASRERPRRSR